MRLMKPTKHRTWLPYTIILLLFSAMPTYAITTPAEEARQLIIEKSGLLLTALKQQHQVIKDNPGVAFDLAEATVLPHIDFNKAAQLVLGKHWRGASAAQRSRFTHAFRAYLVGTYVDAMVKYVDDILSLSKNVNYPELRQQGTENRKVTIYSVITLADGKNAEVDYRLYLDGQQWKIYDVVIESVSMAITYRSTFYSQISQVGLDGLITQLEERSSKREPVN